MKQLSCASASAIPDVLRRRQYRSPIVNGIQGVRVQVPMIGDFLSRTLGVRVSSVSPSSKKSWGVSMSRLAGRRPIFELIWLSPFEAISQRSARLPVSV